MWTDVGGLLQMKHQIFLDVRTRFFLKLTQGFGFKNLLTGETGLYHRGSKRDKEDEINRSLVNVMDFIVDTLKVYTHVL